MDEKYGDGSDHEACEKCDLCITCGDCAKLGCGADTDAKQAEEFDAVVRETGI